jgi:aminopeptidase N
MVCRRYIERYSYGNACTEDLWECLGSVDGTSVADIMHCWVSNVGFPIVKVGYTVGAVFFIL